MCSDKREKRKWKSRMVWAPFEISLYPKTTAAQTQEWNIVLNECVPFVAGALPSDADKLEESILFLFNDLSLSKTIANTCWLTFWGLHHVWYIVKLRLSTLIDREWKRTSDFYYFRTFALQWIVSSKSAVFTKIHPARAGVPHVPVK